MNPIKAARNSSEHPFKAMLASWFGKKTLKISIDKVAYEISTWCGMDFMTGVKK